MLVLGFAIALTGAAGLLGAGFSLEQGWLTVLGMLGLAAAMVAGIVLATNPKYQPQATSPSRVAPTSRAPFTPRVSAPRLSAPRLSEGTKLGLGFGVAITGAAALLGAGFSLEQGWLTVLGMLGLAASMVAGIVKASSPPG